MTHISHRSGRHLAAWALCLALGHAGISPARAEDAPPTLALSAEYIADVTAVARGPRTGTRYTDLLSLQADLSLEQAAGWQGARLFAHGQIGFGQEPNRLADSLQGINNSEVADNRARLFELYLEQAFSGPVPGSLRLGWSDLNAEFYATESSGLLIAPAFGIGSELAATGANGPSIFPSAALGARLRLEPSQDTYVQAAVVDARAGVIGDRGGVPPLLRDGALAIAEAGISRGLRLAVGGWQYSRRQDDLFRTDGAGQPRRRRAQGAYVLAEWPLPGGITPFLRAGVSDGDTGPFSGGWQAGFLAEGPFPGRPDGQLSLGVAQGMVGGSARRAAAAAGQPLRVRETGWELTYADRIAPWLTVQPDVQYVRRAGKATDPRDAVVLTLRLTVGWSRD